MINIAVVLEGEIKLEELGSIDSKVTIKDLYVAEEFIIVHYENQDIVLYYMRDDGNVLEEVPGSRLNPGLPIGYAFDV